jgi:hypothetical protein
MAKRKKNCGRQPHDRSRPGDRPRPITFDRGAAGRPVAVGGVRRVRAVRLPPERGVPGSGPAGSLPARAVPPPAGTGRRHVAEGGDRQ